MPRLLIADGSSQIHRTYHALARMGQNLTASDGTPTGALLGFLNVLRKAIRQHEPTHLVVTFDKSRRSFRTELFPAYKEQREATPEELIKQLQLAREALAALRIPVIELEGWEADDVIATLATAAPPRGFEVVILSSDKDLMQLVRPGVVLHHAQRDELMDEAAVEAYFGVPPARVADVLAIMGDSSDNIPGVKGIGEKGALALVLRHGSIENILEHLDGIESDEELGRTRKRMATLLREQADDLRLARRLVGLDDHAPLPLAIDDLVVQPPDAEATRALFTRLGFTRLISDLKLGSAPAPAPASPASESAAGAAAAPEPRVAEFAGTAATALRKACDDARSSGRLGLSLAAAHPQGLLPLGEPPAHLGLSGAAARAAQVAVQELANETRAALASALTDRATMKSAHGLKALQHALAEHGFELQGPLFDADLAAGLIEWGRWRNLAALVGDVLGETEAGDAPASPAAEAEALWRLQPILRARLDEAGLARLFDEIETPLIPVLASMETAGIRLDPRALEELRSEMQSRLDELNAECFRLAGREFNVASPKQLREILFGEMGLTPGGKTAKTGELSTSSDVLDQLVDAHPIVASILEHREVSKLLGTYVEVLPRLVRASTGRVHATFHQLGAETGRLSCTDPNLQNIPVGSSRVDLQACKLEYSIVSPK